MFYMRRAGDLDAIFQSLVLIRAGALLIVTDPLFIFNSPREEDDFPYRVGI
jgi:hypothetical protein